MKKIARPLEGVLVVDLTRVYSGPYGSMMLADLGADVIKIERKGFGEDNRQFHPIPKPGKTSGYYMYLNRNKKSIELDMKDPKAISIIHRLCEKADVVVENFAPGVADKLKVGYEEIKKINPAIIYGSISGFGQTGPYRDKVAYDLVSQAMGGYMSISGNPDEPPLKCGTSIVDALSGAHLAFAVIAALYSRKRTRKGQYIDVSMLDIVVSTLEDAVVRYTYGKENPFRTGNRSLIGAPYNCFKTKDDYVSITVTDQARFASFARLLGKADWIQNPKYISLENRLKNVEELETEVGQWALQYTTQELHSMLTKAGIPAAPVLSLRQIVEHEQIASRNMLVTVQDPVEGEFRSAGNPMKFSESKLEEFVYAPLLGEHTMKILRDHGYTQEEIDIFAQEDVIVKHDYQK